MFGSILNKLFNQPSSLTTGSLDSRPALNVWMQRVCSGSTVVTSALEYSRKMVRDVNMVTSSTPGSVLSVQNNPITWMSFKLFLKHAVTECGGWDGENYLYSKTPRVCAVHFAAVQSRPHDSSQLCSWERWEQCAKPVGCLVPAVHSQLQQSPSPPLSTPQAADRALWAALTHCLQREEKKYFIIYGIKSNFCETSMTHFILKYDNYKWRTK